MTTKRQFDLPIRTQTDLERVWRQLMEPLGFSGFSVWVLEVGADDHPVPQITRIEDAVRPPEADDLERFADYVRDFATVAWADGSRMAFLLSRPGCHRATARDRAWAARLYAACRLAGMPCETIHLATDLELVPLPLDALDTPASG